MAAINLYPPIVDSYMPAFLNPEGDIKYHKCRIYFSLSPLNTYDEIKYVQISVVNQRTNKNALHGKYSNGIKMVALNYPDTETGLYYVDLYVGRASNNEICDMEKFEVNQYYKVQFRFSNQSATSASNEEDTIVLGDGMSYSYIAPTSAWLSVNSDKTSEWSTVCLIKGISNPKFEFSNSAMNDLNSINSGNGIKIPSNLPIIGTFGFTDPLETEYLKSYRITLSNVDSTEKYEDTGNIFPDSFNPNSINYVSKYIITPNKVYTLRIEYVTSNLYNGAFVYKVKKNMEDILDFPATLTAYANRDEDQIMLKIDFNNLGENVMTSGDAIIKRASSDNKFLLWENIHKVSISKLAGVGAKGYLWGDTTIQSGKWYKYAIQAVVGANTADETYSDNIILEQPVSLALEEICLVGSNSQLKIKYNPKISSLNHKVVQSITETIGSQFPFVRRNGNINYRTFSISGLITRHMDENELFASQTDVYGNSDMIPYYEEYNQENRINVYNDHTYEYLFREKVIEFLNDGKVKLFRSPSEGNMLIVLSNISLSPEETLGRLVYTFTATATEVAKSNIDNYMLYNIIDYEATKYLLQGLNIIENDGEVTAYISEEDIEDGDYVINAGAQVLPTSTTLILTTF